MNNVKIKLQLDLKSPLLMKRHGEKMGKARLITSGKIPRGATGNKLNFMDEFTCNISFIGKTKKKLLCLY